MASERILLVEDSTDVREFLAHSVLAGAGYDVLTARSGAEGLVIAQDLRPDLILSDYLMPELTGLEMYRALRDSGLDIPMILMTAEGSEELAVQALRAGVHDYLIKPIDADVLLDSIREVMRRFWAGKLKERIPTYLFEANRTLERRLREFNTLVQIGTSVTAMLDIQQVLNSVVDAAVDLTRAEEGSLLLIDHTTGELYARAVRSADQKTVQSLRLKVQDSLAGQVITTGQPLVVAGGDLVKIKTAYLVKSVVYVPLRFKGKALGALTVDNRAEERTFDPHDVQLLSLLADFASVALENARIYTATSKERDTLDAILRETEDHVVVVDADNCLLFCNPVACRTFQVSPDDYIGRPVSSVIQNPELVSLLARDPNDQRGRRSEIVVGSSDKVLNAQLTIIEGIGRAAVMQDITHLKRLDQAKSDFVSTVAHDLRSPLTAVLGYTELLQRAGALNEQQNRFVEQIMSSVHSITELITELLELSRIEAGYNADLEPVALDAVARQVIDNFDPLLVTKGHTLNVDIARDLPRVMGNALRLRQMVANLLGNAIKYTPDRGEVSLRLWHDADFVVLQVQDTGIGIPAEDQPYVFDKFFRSHRAVTDFEGTGLGLSIVKGIITQHNGRVWLESKENEGTTFTVMLPTVQAQSSNGHAAHG